MTIEVEFAKYQQQINQALANYLPESDANPLHEAIRYSVLGGGKRLRPLLIYSLGKALGISPLKLDQAACAVELIHAYSLIHDDLPMMDNDDWRRGKPSCHKVFGEAIALLAGDALQALAFEVLLKAPLEPLQILAMVNTLTKAVGVRGMVGGQAMEFSKLNMSLEKLETIYRLKTGSLFRASLELVGIAANLSPLILSSLTYLGNVIGQIYQLKDDICDNEKELNFIKKDIGKDFQSGLLASLDNLEFLLPTFSKQAFLRLLSCLFSTDSERLLSK